MRQITKMSNNTEFFSFFNYTDMYIEEVTIICTRIINPKTLIISVGILKAHICALLKTTLKKVNHLFKNL